MGVLFKRCISHTDQINNVLVHLYPLYKMLSGLALTCRVGVFTSMEFLAKFFPQLSDKIGKVRGRSVLLSIDLSPNVFYYRKI